MQCFGKGDIRGIYPTQVNEELAYRIGRYFRVIIENDEKLDNVNSNGNVTGTGNGTGIGSSRLRVAVGHDIRLSGPSLKKVLVKGLTEAGCDVVDIGQCGTEMIYFATAHLKLAGGIMITASHNPKAYNGFKLVRSGARPVSEDSGLRELEELCSREPAVSDQLLQTAGRAESYDILPEYVKHLLSYVDVAAMGRLAEQQGRRLRVVVNAGNGAAGPVLDVLAEKLPFEFIKVHNQPDGNFPNGVPNPLLRENRDATADVVRKYGADVGIAWDGDFDRCFLFDEEGGMIEGYYMVGFLAEAFLKKYPGARIIHDPRVYWNTKAICQEFGGESVMCRSGHAFIKAKMREVDAVYGGEMSAHHYFRDFAYCDSGMIPWLLVLELLQQSGRKLSELLAERLDMYPCSGEINSKVASTESASRLVEYVESHYADGVRDYTDGLSVAYPRWRFNLRKSNTEPVIRLNVEAVGDKKLLKKRTDELLQMIRS
ncbi:phosphomannomutase, partial [Anaerovibrio slackiae]|uniref:phosphomannomutase n=1 Tax=Anaerovibrio slackiae TaxID=2652309 RepID=UPI0038687210